MGSTAEVKNSFSFARGFITEASALTFPEDASLDEENYVIKTDGSRRKRFGMDFEESFVSVVGKAKAAYDISTVDTFLWENAGDKSGYNILVVQVGNTLDFFDASDTGQAISSNKLTATIDLNGSDTDGTSFLVPGITDMSPFAVSMASGKGVLYVNSSVTEPFYVTIDPETDSITSQVYTILIRDFDGLEEVGLDIDTRPPTLTADHDYNLRNQGWPNTFINSTSDDGAGVTTSDPVDYTESILQVFPSNADLIWTAKLDSAVSPEAVGAYWPEGLLKILNGSSNAAKGHFILNATSKDRTEASGIINLPPVETIATRPESVAFYAGRTWLGLNNTIYYSQILRNVEQSGKCYQEADPTGETINELVATDGGTIEIPDCGIIKQIIPIGTRLIILATQGIWQIDGSRDPFSATNNRSTQLSSIGVAGSKAGVLVETTVLYSTGSGIYTISPDQTTENLTVSNITETTIQAYYLTRVEIVGNAIRGHYDPVGRKVYWLWGTSSPTERYYDMLVFDTSLQAFTKNRLSTGSGDDFPFLAAAFTTADISTVIETNDVITSGGDAVVTSLGNTVVVQQSRVVRSATSIKFLSIIPTVGIYNYTFSEFRSIEKSDWLSHTADGLDYEAFLTTGYDIRGDSMRYKQAPVIQVTHNQTEKNFIDNGEGGSTFDFPSSVRMSAAWNWSDNPISGKVSMEQEVYRFRRPYLLGPIGTPFVTGLPVVTTRSKIRGRGRSLHLKFRCPPRMHSELLGWSILYTGNSSV